MKLDQYSTPQAVLAEWGKRLAQRRIALRMSQVKLSEKAGISLKTVRNMEAGKDLQVSTLIRVMNVLGEGDKLDFLLPEVTLTPMEMLRRAQKIPKRASSPRTTTKKNVAKNPAWKWGDES